MILISFLFFMFLFLAVGLYATAQHKNNTDDYLLAGRDIPAWMAGLSAAASLNSGFIFIGYIGMVYTLGIYGSLFMVGIYIGYLSLWPWLPRGIHDKSRAEKTTTFSKFISVFNKKNYKYVTIIAAILTIFFLLIYAAAQLTAGSKALHTLFDWPLYIGVLVSSLILFIYSFTGGIRASIWTDSVQMCVMVVSMLILAIGGLQAIGSFDALFLNLEKIDPKLVTFSPKGSLVAFLFGLSWALAGLAWSGQPHVMVRFMTLKESAKNKMLETGLSYFISGILFGLCATIVALETRVLITDLTDPELALPTLALNELHPALAGLMLAGLFAATMSTADSLVLSCSSTLSQDLIPNWKGSLTRARLGTLIIIIAAILISIFGDKSVFSLVILAFGVLGVAFGPIVILKTLNRTPSQTTLLLMMAGSISSLLTWRYLSVYNKDFTEIAVGILVAFIIYALCTLIERLFSNK